MEYMKAGNGNEYVVGNSCNILQTNAAGKDVKRGLNCNFSPKHQIAQDDDDFLLKAKQEVYITAGGKRKVKSCWHKCNVCTKHFLTSRKLKLHMKSHLKAHRCHLCRKTFDDKSLLIKHRHLHKIRTLFRCSICNKVYKNLNVHKVDHLKEIVYEFSRYLKNPRAITCKICYNIVDTLPEVIVETERAKESKGGICGGDLTLFDKVVNTLKSHKKEMQCKIYPKIFKALESEVMVHECQSCSQIFSKVGDLAVHKRSHYTILQEHLYAQMKLSKFQVSGRSNRLKLGRVRGQNVDKSKVKRIINPFNRSSQNDRIHSDKASVVKVNIGRYDENVVQQLEQVSIDDSEDECNTKQNMAQVDELKQNVIIGNNGDEIANAVQKRTAEMALTYVAENKSLKQKDPEVVNFLDPSNKKLASGTEVESKEVKNTCAVRRIITLKANKKFMPKWKKLHMEPASFGPSQSISRPSILCGISSTGLCCKVCDQTFSKSGDMIAHRLLHTEPCDATRKDGSVAADSNLYIYVSNLREASTHSSNLISRKSTLDSNARSGVELHSEVDLDDSNLDRKPCNLDVNRHSNMAVGNHVPVQNNSNSELVELDPMIFVKTDIGQHSNGNNLVTFIADCGDNSGGGATASASPSSETPFTCPYCNKTYKNGSRLRYHMKAHTDEPYVCGVCNKNFSQKNSLRVHLYSVHNKDRPHICDDCGKSFPRFSFLKRHQAEHTKPFQCDTCNGRFSTNSYLQDHIRTVHVITSGPRKRYKMKPSNRSRWYAPRNARTEQDSSSANLKLGASVESEKNLQGGSKNKSQKDWSTLPATEEVRRTSKAKTRDRLQVIALKEQINSSTVESIGFSGDVSDGLRQPEVVSCGSLECSGLQKTQLEGDSSRYPVKVADKNNSASTANSGLTQDKNRSAECIPNKMTLNQPIVESFDFENTETADSETSEKDPLALSCSNYNNADSDNDVTILDEDGGSNVYSVSNSESDSDLPDARIMNMVGLKREERLAVIGDEAANCGSVSDHSEGGNRSRVKVPYVRIARIADETLTKYSFGNKVRDFSKDRRRTKTLDLEIGRLRTEPLCFENYTVSQQLNTVNGDAIALNGDDYSGSDSNDCAVLSDDVTINNIAAVVKNGQEQAVKQSKSPILDAGDRIFALLERRTDCEDNWKADGVQDQNLCISESEDEARLEDAKNSTQHRNDNAGDGSEAEDDSKPIKEMLLWNASTPERRTPTRDLRSDFREVSNAQTNQADFIEPLPEIEHVDVKPVAQNLCQPEDCTGSDSDECDNAKLDDNLPHIDEEDESPNRDNESNIHDSSESLPPIVDGDNHSNTCDYYQPLPLLASLNAISLYEDDKTTHNTESEPGNTEGTKKYVPKPRALPKLREQCFKQLDPDENIRCKLCRKVIRRRHVQIHAKIHKFDTRCIICGKECKNKSHLNRHVYISHSEERRFACDICGRAYKSKQGVQDHTKYRHGNSEMSYACEICGKCFAYEAGRDRHQDNHRGKEDFICGVCSSPWSTKADLRKHIRCHMLAYNNSADKKIASVDFEHSVPTKTEPNEEEEESEETECEVCLKLIHTEQLQSHMMTHTSDALCLCETCGKRCDDQFDLSEHMRCHTEAAAELKPNDQKVECKICFKLVQKIFIQAHLNTHTSDALFQCETCGRNCVDEFNFKKHVASHFQERSFACDICRKVYKERSTLDVHIKNTHSNDGPFTCDTCDKTFPTIKLYTEHKRSHTSVDLDGLENSEELKKSDKETHLKKKIACKICCKMVQRRNMKSHIKVTHASLIPLQCETCERVFKKEMHLRRHFDMVHLGVRNFPCEFCDKAYKTKQALQTHTLYNHNDARPYSCGICGKSFPVRKAWSNHEKTHEPKPFGCEFCNAKFSSKNGIKSHLPIHAAAIESDGPSTGLSGEERDPKLVYKEQPEHLRKTVCKICFKMIQQKNMNLHMKFHDPNVTPQCDICGRTSNSEKNLRKHIMSHSEDRNFTCEVCGKTYKTNQHLEEHIMYRHTDEKPFACDICSKSFPVRRALQKHKKSHDALNSFVCRICGLHLTSIYHLRKHKKTHLEKDTETPERVYECDVCHKSYKKLVSFHYHKKSAHSVWQYKCEICERMFLYPTNLKRHMLVHQLKPDGGVAYKIENASGITEKIGAKIFERERYCDHCDMWFPNPTALKVHRREIKGQKLYGCDVCEKKFPHRASLNIHVRIHTGEKPFQCRICNQAFAYKYRRVQHIMQEHKEEFEESKDLV